MGLSDSIKRAAQQQNIHQSNDVESKPKKVNLGSGRTSNYGYNGVGRPTNEGYQSDDSDGQIINE